MKNNFKDKRINLPAKYYLSIWYYLGFLKVELQKKKFYKEDRIYTFLLFKVPPPFTVVPIGAAESFLIFHTNAYSDYNKKDHRRERAIAKMTHISKKIDEVKEKLYTEEDVKQQRLKHMRQTIPNSRDRAELIAAGALDVYKRK